MVKEVTGFNGQVVTSWGRNLDGDTWTGLPKPVSTIITCRCGFICKYMGFPSRAKAIEQDFVLFLGEWFCSYRCVRIERREGALAEAAKIDAIHVNHLEWYIQASQNLRGPLR